MDRTKKATRAPENPAADPLRVDPGDARLYARRLKEARRVGPLGRFMRYCAGALALAGAVAVFWNFATLREMTVDFSALTSVFERAGSDGGFGAPPSGSEPPTAIVEAVGVAGVQLPTSIGGDPPEPEPLPAVETPPAAATVAASQPTAVAVTPPPTAEPPATPETFDFGLRTVSVSEADASAAVLVLRSGGRRAASVVTWWTTDGTARAGTDYANLGERVERLAAGEQNRTIRIPIIGDRNVEGPETFHVHVAPGETRSESVAELEVIINDDD